MEITRIPVDGVEIGQRHRKPTTAKVDEMAKSIAEIGLLNPVTVRFEGDHCILVSGHTRLLASQSLGVEFIDGHVLDIDAIAGEIAEIDENLIRDELTPIQRSEHLKRRKELFDMQGGKTFPTPGGVQSVGFAKDTEEKTGTTKRSINQAIRRAEKIKQELLDSLPDDTPGTKLDTLSNFTPEEQDQVLERIETVGESVDEAISFIRDEPDEQEKQFKAIKRAWSKNPQGREMFLAWIRDKETDQ